MDLVHTNLDAFLCLTLDALIVTNNKCNKVGTHLHTFFKVICTKIILLITLGHNRKKNKILLLFMQGNLHHLNPTMFSFYAQLDNLNPLQRSF